MTYTLETLKEFGNTPVTQAIGILTGLSLAVKTLEAHSFLQDAAYHLAQRDIPAIGSIYGHIRGY